MQNIDYSRRLRNLSSQQNLETSRGLSRPEYPSRPEYSSKSEFFPNQKSSFFKFQIPTGSFFPLLLGAIFFFTAGMLLGLKLSEKEAAFQTPVGVKKFSNPSMKTGGDDHNSEKKETLAFPPKEDQINYVVELGNLEKKDAAILQKMEQTFPERVFKTMSGKYYLGYFYSKAEAESSLEQLPPGVSGAKVVSIRL